MSVILQKMTLKKRDLDRLSGNGRRFFVVACHIANDLATLQKILVAAMQSPHSTAVGLQARGVQCFVISKILAGKLSEAWQALQRYYFSGLSKEIEQELSAEAAGSLNTIKKYFNTENSISKVRNEAAFHYDADAVIQTLAGMPEDREFALFLGEQSGNSLYYFAEEVLADGLLKQLPGNSNLEALDRFVADVQRVSLAFMEFIEGVAFVALKQAAPDAELIPVEVHKSETGSLQTASIPYFLEMQSSS